MSKHDPEIVPVRVLAREYRRHPNTIHKTWLRAQMPVFPVEIKDKAGKRRVVKGIDRKMFEAFLMAGGFPRRLPSIAIGREVKKKFGIID